MLSIETEDQPGMLARLTEAIAKHHCNIRHIEADTEDSGRGLIEVMIEVRDRRHLQKLHESLQALPGVLHVDRRMASVSGADSKS